VSSAVDLIVHMARFRDGSRHVTHVTEVVGMEGEVITLQDLFVYEYLAPKEDRGRAAGGLRATGLRPKFLEKLAIIGVHVDPAVFASAAIESPRR
jgi:pilus assembly protein CpaF